MVPRHGPGDVAVTQEPMAPQGWEAQGRVCHLRKRATQKKALKVEVTVVLRDGTSHTLPALVDTGAEYNLCNPKSLCTDQWEDSHAPIVLLAANESVVKGGDLELQTTLEVKGRTKSTGDPRTFRFHASFYQADIGTPLILSYDWLARHGMVVDGGYLVLGT